MTQIRITATGQGGKKRTALLRPSSIEELKEAIIDIAYGFHCDYDKVIADIVDGNGEVTIQHCDMCESDNLLFVGYNCDDGISQESDGRFYDSSLDEYFDEYDEALKANTREDYDDNITGVYERYLDVIVDEIRAVSEEPEYLTDEEEKRVEDASCREENLVAYDICGINSDAYCYDEKYRDVFSEVRERGVDLEKFAFYYGFKILRIDDEDNGTLEFYEI